MWIGRFPLTMLSIYIHRRSRMRLLLSIATISMSGVMGVAMGFFNLGVRGGERFAPWDFILGGMCVGLAVGMVLQIAITTKSKGDE